MGNQCESCRPVNNYSFGKEEELNSYANRLSTPPRMEKQPRQTIYQTLYRSQNLSESQYQTNLYRVNSSNDQNIKNDVVKSRISNMPLASSSRLRSLYGEQNEKYLPDIQAKYVGEMDNYIPNGHGKLFFDNGDYYEGEFATGRCEGQGRFIRTDGSFYEGAFKNNIADGNGTYIDAKGYKYQGQWKNNMHNGHGESTMGALRYVGQFFNNKRHGKGILYDQWDVYRGEFRNNKIEGKAVLQRENGEKYSGMWKNNLQEGLGRYQWVDGSYYEGEYKGGQRQGKGKMFYSDGSYYDGQWKNGKKNGIGQFRNEKQHFRAHFKDGVVQKIIE